MYGTLKPLFLAFVDYEKAFNNVESKAVLTSLEKQGIDKGYMDALAESQNGASTVAMLYKESNGIPIRKGVRQGDTISQIIRSNFPRFVLYLLLQSPLCFYR